MGRTLIRYLLRHHLIGLLLTTFSLTVLFIAFDFLDEFGDVGQGAFDNFDAVFVVLMGLPKRIVELSSFSCALGVFYTFGYLSRSNELAAIQCAGVATSSIVIVSLCCVTGFLLLLAGLEVVARPLYQSALEYRDMKVAERPNKSLVGHGLWMLEGGTIVFIDRYDESDSMRGVKMFEFDQADELSVYSSASKLENQGEDNWALIEGIRKFYRDDKVSLEDFDRMQILLDMNPRETLASLPLDSLTLSEISRRIEKLKQSLDDTTALEVQFWSRLSIPMQIVAFSLLAVVLSLGTFERGGLGMRMLLGVAICLSLYVFTLIATNASYVLGFPAYLASTLPVASVVILTFSIVALRKY
ncbi:MAG: LptF/LptG family permease [Pseudomonadales bacterium]